MIEFLKNLPDLISALIVVITTLGALVVSVATVIKAFIDRDANALQKTVEAVEANRGKLKALRSSGALDTLEKGIEEGLKLVEEHRGKTLPPKLVRKARNRIESILRDEGMK